MLNLNFKLFKSYYFRGQSASESAVIAGLLPMEFFILKQNNSFFKWLIDLL